MTWIKRTNLPSELSGILLNWVLPFLILISCCLCLDVDGLPSSDIYRMNKTVEGFYDSKEPYNFIKPPKKRDTTKETQRALFLICGVILGVPLGVLAACGVREFVCAMYEKYRLEALRRNYLYRMKIPTTVPVR